ncbi:MAG: hypothetical protein IKY46_07850 [Clostridia bacterium]|nr:hypothetical protein [Clostridia bacterium]
MKTYAPALVREISRTPGLKGLIVSARQDAGYYYAENAAEGVSAMWIEACQFGRTVAYPCMLKVKEDIMIYKSGAGANTFEKDANKKMLAAWAVFMKPADFAGFELQKLSTDDFAAKLKSYTPTL